MRDYEIKRGHAKKTGLLEEGVLGEIMEELFEGVEKAEEFYRANYAALTSVEARIVDAMTLQVDTVLDPGADFEAAKNAHQAWNDFLLKVTGFNAKQRADRAKKKAKEIAKKKAEAELEGKA